MKSNKSRSSGSGSFSERYSGGARESKIVDREFRVFLITSFYSLPPPSCRLTVCLTVSLPLLLHSSPLSHLASWAMSFHVVRPNRRVCRAPVYSHTNDCAPSLLPHPCLLHTPLASPARLNLLSSGPLVQPHADVRARTLRPPPPPTLPSVLSRYPCVSIVPHLHFQRH